METSEMDISSERASPGLAKEASRFKVLEKANYVCQVEKVTYRTWLPNDPEKCRKVANIQVGILIDQRKAKTLWCNLSWMERRGANGGLDMPSRLYGQLQKALFPTATQADMDNMPVEHVFEVGLQYPVMGYVTTGYEVPNAKNPKYTNVQIPRSKVEAEAFIAQGYPEANTIISFNQYQEGA